MIPESVVIGAVVELLWPSVVALMVVLCMLVIVSLVLFTGVDAEIDVLPIEVDPTGDIFVVCKLKLSALVEDSTVVYAAD